MKLGRDKFLSRGMKLGRNKFLSTSMECGDELRLLDQAGMQSQHAEEQMAFGSHWSPPGDLGRKSVPATIETWPVDGQPIVAIVHS
jgi:hypothetical protein